MKAYVGEREQSKQLNLGPLLFYADACLTKLTWQVLAKPA